MKHITPSLLIIDQPHLDSEKTFFLESGNFTTLNNSISDMPNRSKVEEQSNDYRSSLNSVKAAKKYKVVSQS